MSTRTLVSLHPAQRDDIGDLLTRRPLPGPGLPQVDPFLFLNHHGPQIYPPGNNGLPFGPHPHRGFETVTFVLHGSLAHHDTGGGKSVVGPGGVQWMTAGRGIVHAELSPDAFRREGGPLEILQLWVNLPARLKMAAPDYIEVRAAQVDEVELTPGAVFRAVSGTTAAPVEPLTGIVLGTVELAPDAEVTLPAPAERNVLFYTIRGSARIGEDAVPQANLALLSNDGEDIAVASEDGCLLLYGHAEPIGEPVVAHGPFVMNSEAEIVEAIEAYRRGEFGDPDALA